MRDVAQIESEVCADAKLIEATQTNTPYWYDLKNRGN